MISPNPHKPVLVKSLKKVCSCFVIVTFFTLQMYPLSAKDVYAQSVLDLPSVGSIIAPSLGYTPAIMKGIKVYPDNPLKFDFIIDSGDSGMKGAALKEESSRLIKYFLATLTVPEKDLWVNLSPKEKDNIIPDAFGVTEMGRDLLAQDYLLKQMTASFLYPDSKVGQEFWKKVYAEALARYGTTDIPINTFNRVWIVPEEAVVYENQDGAYIVDSRLKVLLEEDYLMSKYGPTGQPGGENSREINSLGSEVVREIVIPVLEKEVNQGKHFSRLRQIYHSLILAVWFKDKVKGGLLGEAYVDKNKTGGIEIEDKAEKEKIWAMYVESFKRGVYDYIKEEYDPAAKEFIPRQYFSGGMGIGSVRKVMQTCDHGQLPENVSDDSVIVETNFALSGGKSASSAEKDVGPAALSKSWMEDVRVKMMQKYSKHMRYLPGIPEALDQALQRLRKGEREVSIDVSHQDDWLHMDFYLRGEGLFVRDRYVFQHDFQSIVDDDYLFIPFQKKAFSDGEQMSKEILRRLSFPQSEHISKKSLEAGVLKALSDLKKGRKSQLYLSYSIRHRDSDVFITTLRLNPAGIRVDGRYSVSQKKNRGESSFIIPIEQLPPSFQERISQDKPLKTFYPLGYKTKNIEAGKSRSFEAFKILGLDYPYGIALTKDIVSQIKRGEQDFWEDFLDVLQNEFEIPEMGQADKVAVRSAPIVSMPGRMESVLNVDISDREALKEAIIRVAHSWDSDKAKDFRRLNGLSDEVKSEIIIQRMVPQYSNETWAAGSFFTTDPDKGNTWPLGRVVENTFGDAVMTGGAKGESLYDFCQKYPGLWDQIKEIAQKLETYYDFPQEVEFVISLTPVSYENGLPKEFGVDKISLLSTRDLHFSPQGEMAWLERNNNPFQRVALLEKLQKHRGKHMVRKQYRLRQGEIGSYPLKELSWGRHIGGAMKGVLVTRPESFEKYASAHQPVILAVTEETEDEMLALAFEYPHVGVITNYGNMSSHVADLLRLAGIPADISANFEIDGDRVAFRRQLNAIKKVAEGQNVWLLGNGNITLPWEDPDVIEENEEINNISFGIDLETYKNEFMASFLAPDGKVKKGITYEDLVAENVDVWSEYIDADAQGRTKDAFMFNIRKHYLHEVLKIKAAEEGRLGEVRRDIVNQLVEKQSLPLSDDPSAHGTPPMGEKSFSTVVGEWAEEGWQVVTHWVGYCPSGAQRPGDDFSVRSSKAKDYSEALAEKIGGEVRTHKITLIYHDPGHEDNEDFLYYIAVVKKKEDGGAKPQADPVDISPSGIKDPDEMVLTIQGQNLSQKQLEDEIKRNLEKTAEFNLDHYGYSFGFDRKMVPGYLHNPQEGIYSWKMMAYPIHESWLERGNHAPHSRNLAPSPDKILAVRRIEELTDMLKFVLSDSDFIFDVTDFEEFVPASQTHNETTYINKIHSLSLKESGIKKLAALWIQNQDAIDLDKIITMNYGGDIISVDVQELGKGIFSILKDKRERDDISNTSSNQTPKTEHKDVLTQSADYDRFIIVGSREEETLPADAVSQKGANLLIMKELDLPVPEFIVVTTYLFRKMNSQRRAIDYDILAESILKAFPGLEEKFELVVRPGAVVTMPGVLPTRKGIVSKEQLAVALRQSYEAWDDSTVQVYAESVGVSRESGIAIVIQREVHGDRSQNSASGIFHTRDPETGTDMLTGSYRINAAGEATMSGKADSNYRTVHDHLAVDFPKLALAFARYKKTLESYYQYPQIVEFVFDNGQPWLVQTDNDDLRSDIEVRILEDMYEQGILKSPKKLTLALQKAGQKIFYRVKKSLSIQAWSEGIPLSASAVQGVLVFSVEKALEARAKGQKVILVSAERNDGELQALIKGEIDGLITFYGNRDMHDARLARLAYVPAVAFVEDPVIQGNALIVNGVRFLAGEQVVLDGNTGRLIRTRSVKPLEVKKTVTPRYISVDVQAIRQQVQEQYGELSYDEMSGDYVESSLLIWEMERNLNLFHEVNTEEWKHLAQRIVLADMRNHYLHELLLLRAREQKIAKSDVSLMFRKIFELKMAKEFNVSGIQRTGLKPKTEMNFNGKGFVEVLYSWRLATWKPDFDQQYKRAKVMAQEMTDAAPGVQMRDWEWELHHEKTHGSEYFREICVYREIGPHENLFLWMGKITDSDFKEQRYQALQEAAKIYGDNPEARIARWESSKKVGRPDASEDDGRHREWYAPELKPGEYYEYYEHVVVVKPLGETLPKMPKSGQRDVHPKVEKDHQKTKKRGENVTTEGAIGGNSEVNIILDEDSMVAAIERAFKIGAGSWLTISPRNFAEAKYLGKGKFVEIPKEVYRRIHDADEGIFSLGVYAYQTELKYLKRGDHTPMSVPRSPFKYDIERMKEIKQYVKMLRSLLSDSDFIVFDEAFEDFHIGGSYTHEDWTDVYRLYAVSLLKSGIRKLIERFIQEKESIDLDGIFMFDDEGRAYECDLKILLEVLFKVEKKKKTNVVGGIDLTPERMGVEVRGAGQNAEFKIDPVLFQQIKNAAGLTPVILNIRSMTMTVPMFLGLNISN